MTSLFLPFDSGSFKFLFSFFMFGLLMFLLSFYKNSFSSKILSYLFIFMKTFFSSLKPGHYNKFGHLFFVSVFACLLIVNFLSVFSFNFPCSSQVSVVFHLSLGSWIALILFSAVFNFKGLLSHFIPEGTPLALTILLFVIELVSSVIRPITLMVRLVANILAGHLLMSLLSSLVFQFGASFPLYLVLNSVELFVALIQSYIFSTMLVLYFAEV